MKNKKIIILGGKGESTNIVFHALNKSIGINLVILEEKESIKIFIKRRIKRLGLSTVIGQILFQVSICRLLKIISRKRIAEIINTNDLNIKEIPSNKIQHVSSINSKASIELINKINPDLIIVNGTRIISKKVLQSANCKFINTHAGITPMYRGVHGAYWALVNEDLYNSGVTVHFVDEGIDTGNIIAQARINHTSKDNFTTYPLLQLSVGIGLLIKSIQQYFDNSIALLKENGESNLYYHPTIWQYVYNRVTKKVK